MLVSLFAVGLSALAGGGWWLINSAQGDAGVADDSTPEWAVVSYQDIEISVFAEGDLVAKDNIDIYNLIEHPDDERIREIVEEGTWVNGPSEPGGDDGDWLYTLSSPGLEADLEEWQSRVREAQADLDEAEQNKLIEEDIAASALATAQLDLELAQLAYQQWESGTHVQRVNDLDLALEKAERELRQAIREVELSRELYAQEFISQTELDDDEIALIEAENALATAQLDIEVYNSYEQVMTEREMQSSITQAQDELRRTENKNANRMQLMLAQIESAQSELEQRTSRMLDLERMVGYLTVNAPGDGTVIYSSTIGNRRERWYTIRPGTEVRGGWRIMVLSDTSQLVANLYVHESRINLIEPDQEVAVSISARPDEVFTAVITERKNSAIQEGGSNPHLRQYQVLADMPPNLGDDIRPGMVCSGEIYIRQIPNALSVPIQAVHTEGNEHFVYVEAGEGKVRRQKIEIGGASDTLVEVLSGLEEGTRVLLRSPRPGEEQVES